MQFSIWKHSRMSAQTHSTPDDGKALSFVSDKGKALILVKYFFVCFHCFLSYTSYHVFLSLLHSVPSIFSLPPHLFLRPWFWGHLLPLLHTYLLQSTIWLVCFCWLGHPSSPTSASPKPRCSKFGIHIMVSSTIKYYPHKLTHKKDQQPELLTWRTNTSSVRFPP